MHDGTKGFPSSTMHLALFNGAKLGGHFNLFTPQLFFPSLFSSLGPRDIFTLCKT